MSAGTVPKEFTGIAKNITEGHRLFQAATREFLEYWNDQNTEHIISGQRTLKLCLAIIQNAPGTVHTQEFADIRI
jgi:hypothetical protein